MQKKTVISVIVVAMLLVIALYFISGTYARYVSEFSGNGTVSIAKWAVKLAEGSGTGSSMTLNLTFKNNENVRQNKIAPGVTVEGTAEITLDGTEVAVDIFTDLDESDVADALKTAGIEGVTNSDISVSINATQDEGATNITAITGSGKQADPYVIKLAEGNNTPFDLSDKVKITISVVWTNEDSHSADHTKIGEKGATLNIPVKLYAVQHIESSNYAPQD